MKRNTRQMKITMNGKRMGGVMLLEVVLAIAVFAFGMLALVQLQGNLTRSSADANTRTVATNIAEEIVERIRGYQNVTADPDNGLVDYLELVGNSQDTVVRRGRLGDAEGGLDYAVTMTIKDFWYDPATDAFKNTDATDPPTPPAGLEHLAWADFKMLEVKVAWSPNRDFYVDDENTANLGALDPDGVASAISEITIYEIIPSSPPILGAKIAADLDPPIGLPPVDFTPGFNPDIVAIDLLNGERMKESTTPAPDVIRSGELTETSFDVVTYNTVNSNTFLRREEFVTVGCVCTLRTSVDAGQGGFRPTVWNGVDYTEGEFIAKNFGESASNQQSVFCDVCCRDHHEGGNGDTGGYEVERRVYDPWVGSPTSGTDHAHYTRNSDGDLTPATKDGDEYVEACRLIRKDGFFRVAQDFNKQGFFGFAFDYLDNDFEVEEYSDYIIDAVDDLYRNNKKVLKQPGEFPAVTTFTNPATGVPGPKLPASTDGTPTNLPLLVAPFTIEQQLRSRGIYIDYLTDEARGKIQDCIDTPDTCPLPGYTSELKLALFYPFFEVQLTSLSTWREEIPNIPVHVTDEAIETNNTHSRGLAKLMTPDVGDGSQVFLEILEGNVGIAAVDPIVPLVAPGPAAAAAAAPTPTNVYIATTGTPTDYPGTTVVGDISSGVGGVRASDVEISFDEAQCGRTAMGYACVYPVGGGVPTLTVSNYYKANKTLYACSDTMDIVGDQVTGVDASTTFDLSTAVDGQADIVIQDSSCG